MVLVVVGEVLVVVVDGGIDVDVVVDVLQDASNIAVNSKTLKPNQINFFFIFYSYYVSQKHNFPAMSFAFLR